MSFNQTTKYVHTDNTIYIHTDGTKFEYVDSHPDPSKWDKKLANGIYLNEAEKILFVPDNIKMGDLFKELFDEVPDWRECRMTYYPITTIPSIKPIDPFVTGIPNTGIPNPGTGDIYFGTNCTTYTDTDSVTSK